MGLYIQTGANHGKAEWLVKNHNAKVVTPSTWQHADPLNVGLVVVVDNGPFEAAAFAPTTNERDYYAKPDGRPMTFLIMDRDVASRIAR